MAANLSSAMTQLTDITECCICLKTFTDPRVLPCIHTFCLQCLKDFADKSDKKPGDEMQCPVCRQEFTLPNDGVLGIQKNFFMARMIEVRNTLNQSKMTVLCDMCKANNVDTEEDIPEATMSCLDCQENLCEGCFKLHKTFKMMKNHETVKIGKDVGEHDIVRPLQTMNCDIHRGKILDYYCAECKKVVCVSCFVESHRTHDCKDVNSVEEEFRKIIKCSATMISKLAGELLAKKDKSERKEDFLKKIADREKSILQRSYELKEMVDEHTTLLLSSLDGIKTRHLKEIQTEEDELDRRLTILESFSRYCDELWSKGSASDICLTKAELLKRADELEEDHKKYITRVRVSSDVTFHASDQDRMLKTSDANIVGSLKVHEQRLEDFSVVIGEDFGSLYSCKINLHRQSERVFPIENVPTTVKPFPAAAVYNHTMFITGIGKTFKEIWKYNFASASWNRCGSLVQCRENHFGEFIGETLYSCGGSKQDIVLDSIESYNALTEESTMEGELIVGSQRAACVAYKGSVYIFGGFDKDWKPLDCVQMFSPVEGTCTFLWKPLPRPNTYMRAVLWRTYAVLLGYDTCFIFDFEIKTWQERKTFKSDDYFFGMFLENERIFIIDGSPKEAHGNFSERCKIEYVVKYVNVSKIVNNEASRWKILCKLPEIDRLIAVAKLSIVQ